MTEKTPIGSLKEALVARLLTLIESDPECPANILAVAAKVVKDFHADVGRDPTIDELNEVVKKYQLRKGEARVN